MRKATLRDVAEAVGVHTATVSRALNPSTRGLVNQATARRVLKAAKALDYQPNPIARNLKTSRSGTVRMVIPDSMNPLFPPMVRGLESVLEPQGYNCWVVSTDNDVAREAELIAGLQTHQVDGFVIATARINDPLLEQMRAAQSRVVLANRRSESPSLPSVTSDDAAGISLAIEHLKSLGHRRIAHLAGPLDTSPGVVRKRAFRYAIRNYGLIEDPKVIVECEDWREEDGSDALPCLMSRRNEFTAIVAGNDLIALGCYDVFREKGLRCPDDISVVGFNDMIFMDKVQPSLTLVRAPSREVGLEAGRLLVEIIKDEASSPRSILLPVELVVRESTGHSAISHPLAEVTGPM